MILTINNKTTFLKFLISVSSLYDQCVIHCSSSNILDVFVSTESEQVIMYGEYCNIVADKDVTINIPDIKKLIKLLGYIPQEQFELEIIVSYIIHLHYHSNIICMKMVLLELKRSIKIC